MKFLLAVFLCMLSISMRAQIATVLTLNKPSATISEWWRNNTTIVYLVTNPDPMPRQVIIKSTLKTADGEMVATKDLSQAAVYSLTDGNRVFTAKEVLPLEQMIFTGNYKNTLSRTGKLPAGVYILEVQLISPANYAVQSSLQSRSFNLAAQQLPVLMSPIDKDSLDVKIASAAITFRWTPLTARGTEQIYYRIQIFEVLPFQHPLQAMRGNYPLLDKEVSNLTQYIWTPQMAFATDSLPKKFIWTIQTLNSNHVPLSSDNNIEARSEPFEFIIRKKN
jgi:hypothetical protein